MKGRARVLVACVVLAFTAVPLGAYLKLGTRVGDRIVSLAWDDEPIRYFITNQDVPGVSAQDLEGAVRRAFATWAGVPGVGIVPEFAGFTSAQPFEEDGASVLGFRARRDLERTLGATTFVVDTVTGEIVESDVFFNATFSWSVAPNGEAQRFDLESIAVHEVGHLLGLSHSALGETELVSAGQRRVIGKAAVMFPIAYPSGTILDRRLRADDVAGISDIYGPTVRERGQGSISGRVTLDGSGVFGAHVVAFNPNTGDLVGTFTLDDRGAFVVSGLAPGVYVLRAEPIDDADPSSFFNDSGDVNVDFQPGFASSLVAVPEGGGVSSIEIKVVRK